MADAQGCDFCVSSAIDQFQKAQKISYGPFKTQTGMKMVNGLLYRGRKVITPRSMKEKIMGLLHNESHMGYDKTALFTKSRSYRRKWGTT